VVKGTLDDSDSAKIIRRFKSVQLISRVKDSMKAYEYVLFSDGCVGLFNMASKIYMIFGKDGDEEDNVYIKEWGKFRCWQYL